MREFEDVIRLIMKTDGHVAAHYWAYNGALRPGNRELILGISYYTKYVFPPVNKGSHASINQKMYSPMN